MRRERIKTVTVKGDKKASKTIKKLKANKKYYVRVRGYKIVDGQEFVSDWSKVEKKKTK